MPDTPMTPAEALEIVLEATASKRWAEAPAEILAGLREVGFALVPIIPDGVAIERVARAICRADGADPDEDGWAGDPGSPAPAWQYYGDEARAAYAAIIGA